jgi:hypothetical protein
MSAACRSSISIDNGRDLLGFVHRKGDGKHHATSPDGQKLGVFRTRKEAADAITAAHAQRQREGSP